MRRSRFFARHVRSRYGTFLDRPKWFPGVSIEYPHKALLTHQCDNVYVPAFMANGEEFGGGGIVIIEHVVVDHLEMPDAAAGAGVDGE